MVGVDNMDLGKRPTPAYGTTEDYAGLRRTTEDGSMTSGLGNRGETMWTLGNPHQYSVTDPNSSFQWCWLQQSQ